MVGIHQGIIVSRCQPSLFNRGPRPPRVGGDVDNKLLTPIPVNFRHRNPLTTEPARLHWVLGPEPLRNGLSIFRVRRPSVASAEFRFGQQLPQWHSRQAHRGSRVWPIRPTPFPCQILLKGVSEEIGVVALTGHGIPVNRRNATDVGPAEVDSRQRAGVVRCGPRDPRMPAQAVAGSRFVPVFFHLDPEHRQLVIDQFAAHRPKPLRQGPLAVALLERRWGR